MATEPVRVQPTLPRYEQVVQTQLARAQTRIRAIDAGVALLGLVGGTLLYALVMAVADRQLELSATARQAAFLFYGVLAAVYTAFFLARPLLRPLNPYYAARRLEEALPGAKNSVINWLDLHDQPLPPAIRGAVGYRAAHDAEQVDIEQAISGRRAAWVGGATGAVALAFVVTLFVLGPPQFLSLLGRAFAPFGGGSVRTRTQLELLRPETGDVTVPVGRGVSFAVSVSGRVPKPDQPDALRLLYWYQEGEPPEERPLEWEGDRVWATTLPADRVHNGFWYQIAGGDDVTLRYRVAVRSTPLLERVQVTYHYRRYVGRRDAVSADPHIKAVRGTEVVLVAHTTHPVKDGKLVIDLKPAPEALRGEPVPDDHALRFHFVLDRSGPYRIYFTSRDGDANADPMPYTITALPDEKPQVELRKPGKDVVLPANGLLQLEGWARDDIGLKSLALHMRVVGGPALQPRPYRPGKRLEFADGGCPQELDYKDAVPLDQLRDEQGQPFAPKPGSVLEYWLLATDNCDYPAPNVAESKRFKVTFGEPDVDKQKLARQRQQAAAEQKQHDQAQDERLAQEEQARQDQGGGANQDPEQEKKDKQRRQDIERKIQEQLDKQQQDQQQGGGQGEDKGEGKDDGKPQPQPGAGKGPEQGGPQGQLQPGQQKGAGGGQDGKDGQPGADKKEGKPDGDPNKGAGKGAQDGGNDAAQPKDTPRPDQGEAKGPGQGDGAKDVAQPRGAGQPDAAAAKDGGQGDQKPQGMGKGDDRVQPGGQAGGPAGGQGDAPKPADPGAKGAGGAGQPQPGRDAKPEDVAGLAKEMAGGDGAKQEEAARRLADAARNAKDQQAREAARKALEQAGRDPQSGEPNPGAAKKAPQDQPGGGPGGDRKAGPAPGQPAPGAGKPGQGQPGGAKGGPSAEAKPDDGGTPQPGAKGRPAGVGKDKGDSGEQPAFGQGGQPGDPGAPQAAPPVGGGPPDPAHKRRAGDLQLEEFRKRVTREVLDAAGIAPEEWEAYLRARAAMVGRQRDDGGPDRPQRPARPGVLRDRGVRRVQPGGDGKQGGERMGSRGGAPPGFGDIYRDFTSPPPEKK